MPPRKKTLLSFGKHAGAALKKTEMLEELNKADELIEALIGKLDEEQLMDKVLELLEDHLHYDYCALLLKNAAGDELEVVASRFPPEVDRNVRVKLVPGKGVTAQAALTEKTKIVPDEVEPAALYFGITRRPL